MNVTVGYIAGGLVLATMIGAGIYAWRRLKQKTDGLAPNIPDNPGPTPSGPPRPATNTDPRGHYSAIDRLEPELRAALDERFPSAWPPDDATTNGLTQEDVIVFAVGSEPTGNYTSTRQELLNAKVLTVQKTVVRARILGPVAHAEHHGSHAGHGFRVGDQVEVPRAKVLVAARPTDAKGSGYDSHGEAAASFKPSDTTKQTYKVKPGTPYDLILPYRTPELAWYVDERLVTMAHIGQKANFEQIMFAEDSLRGDFTVRALDEDPEVGTVFVARWDFVLSIFTTRPRPEPRTRAQLSIGVRVSVCSRARHYAEELDMAASDHPSHPAIEVLTADEVAAMLRVNRKTIYEAAQRGDIPHRRLGRRLVFERGAVLAWLRQGTVIAGETQR